MILQKVGDELFEIALTSHAEYFDGDKTMWLKRHMIAIDWSNCEDLKDEVAAYSPQGEGRQS